MNLLILTLMLLQNGSNPSLFSENAPNLFLFRDFKARNVGDILTIQIVETASATNSASTSTQRDGDIGLSAPALGGLEKGASALNFASFSTERHPASRSLVRSASSFNVAFLTAGETS